MKKLFTLSFILFSLFAKADYWTQKAGFPGSNRFGCFSFSIGNKGYIGCGYDTSWGLPQTFWEYNQQANSWTQKADYAGQGRVYSTGFSIANIGYAGLGVNPGSGWMQDFWKYDPSTNMWDSIADYGGGQRSEACSFVINGKAYVGTGTGVVSPYTFNDLWEYDPLTDIWTAKTSFPGAARIKALGFAAGNYGYITTGFAASTYFSDIWQYDPVADSWTQKTSFLFDPRGGAAGFVLLNKIYLGTGRNHPSTGADYASKDWFKYDPILNQWSQKNSFLGFPRYETEYFAINNEGYEGMGVNGNIQYSDFWEYTGDPLTVNEPGIHQSLYTICPNPCKDYIAISSPSAGKGKTELTITDVDGKIMPVQLLPVVAPGQKVKLNVSHYSEGVYLMELKTGKERVVKKFVKE